MAKSLETSRIELHEKLIEVLGSNNVYFQPPETEKMKYPAILYDLYRVQQRFAGDISYKKSPAWSVTIIDRNEDVDWVYKMLDAFSYCSMERTYKADNLAHYAFIVYYS